MISTFRPNRRAFIILPHVDLGGENIVVYRRDLESLPGKDSIGNIRCMV